MTLDENNPPRGLYRDGKYWYIDITVNRQRIRYSTNLSDINAAFEVLQRERNKKLTCDYDAEWIDYISKIKGDSQGWLRSMWLRAKRRGKSSGKGFDLSYKELVSLVEMSSGRCEVTGIRFSFEKTGNSKTAPFSPSLDRIDSGQGYVRGNCRLVCLCVNLAMREWGLPVLLRIGESVILKHLQEKLDGEANA